MSYMEFRNPTKYVMATLISLMLISAFAASNVATVQASPHPWPRFTLHATVTTNPYWGYYGGYHDIWQAIKTELDKIGINLVIDYYDDFTWYDHVWDTGWNHSGGTPYPPGGWDMTILEWWLQPHALEPWFVSMVAGWLPPEESFNVHPWTNPKADECLWKGMTSVDAETRQYYMWKWQEIFMHDPPWVNIYYPRLYECMGKWVDGYDATGCWWYDITQLKLDTTKMPAERKSLNQSRFYYAVTEEVWSMLPPFMDTYTEEQMETLQWDTLYRWSLKWENFVAGQEPNPDDYIIVPELAAKDPYPVDGNETHMRVELREGIRWSDYDTSGETLDAEDVERTINLFTLDPKAKNSGIADVTWICDHVEIHNSTTVDFILKAPCPDLKSVLANDWGLSILPYHFFTAYDPDPTGLNRDPANTDFDDPTKWAPVTGPFTLKEAVTGDHVLLERNPHYFGFNTSIVGSPAWGPDPNVQAIYLKFVKDPAVRLLEFQTYQLDCGEYPTAPIEVWREMQKDPYLNVFQYNYPASNPIWFNFNNEYLSNRFIRLAIAHAVPYPRIFNEILPSWGIETAYPGKTYVMPVHHYTEPNTGGDLTGSTVHLFNEDLEPFYYSIDDALKYMNMWWYSTGDPYANGPVGDADYSGLVDLNDFSIWRKNPGLTEPVEVNPGNWIDPDFDNDDGVDSDDYLIWYANYGNEYPFPGAR